LFSTVLTAFLIESYKTLQVDKTDVAIQLLQQIAMKDTLTSSTSAQTAPPSSSSDFVAPTWAIRVNVLWFSSLLCSLSVGSFGILVKQWLQEYLAFDSMSAPVRVKAHIDKKKAMKKWRVFEIAAFLPLALQLALLLFFVGMCYFTASVQDSIALASTPLVGGWAFVFLCTIVAPLFWPRCPFKTPWLNTLQRYGHRDSVVRNFRRVCRVFFVSASNKGSANDEEKAETSDAEKGEATNEEKEDATVEDASKSLLLLDETMLDDGLLASICEAFQSSQPGPADIVPFASALINHRLGPTITVQEKNLDHVPDLRSLTLPCWTSVTDLVATNLLSQLKDEPQYGRAAPQQKIDAILFLLSRSRFPLCARGKEALHKCLTHRSWDSVSSQIAACQKENFVPMARPLLDSFKELSPYTVTKLYAECLCPPHLNHRHNGNPGLLSILHDTVRHPDIIHTHRDLINDLFIVLDEVMNTQVFNLEEGAKNLRDGSVEAFLIIWEFWHQSDRNSPRSRAAKQTVKNILCRQSLVAFLLAHCTAMHKPYRVDVLPDIILEVFMESTQSGESARTVGLSIY
jgi:hypothetical protein